MLTQKEKLIISSIWSGKSYRCIENESHICRKTIKNVVVKYNIKPLKQLMFEEGLVRCTSCCLYKKTELFYKGSNKTTMLKSICKDCKLEYGRTPSRKIYSKRWRHENKLVKSEADREYRIKNKERIREYRKSEHYKELKRKSDKKYYQHILKTPKLKLNSRIKSAMSGSIKHSKNNKYLEIVGYTIEDLKKHLEKLFKKGMSWENYGRGGWHVDHIKPLVTFDLTNEEEFKKAWAITNLQPLWQAENLSKGSFYNGERYGKSTKK